MGVIAAKDRPCIDSKGCGSSDAMQVYEDGTAFCFSCRKRFSKEQVAGEGYDIDEETIAAAEAAKAGVTEKKPPTFKLPNSKPSMPGVAAPSSAAVQKAKATAEKLVSAEDGFSVVDTEVVKDVESGGASPEKITGILEYPIRGFKERGVTRAVCEFFGVRCAYDNDGDIRAHFYPYPEGGFKERVLPKKFKWIGNSGKIFGKDRFTHGGRRLIITEGEMDALSIAQMNMDKYKTIFPVIAIPGVSYVKYLLEIREWVRSFKEVVIMMDNDEPGKEALQEAIKIVGYDKAYIVEYPSGCKDANDILVKEGWASLYRVTWDAQPYRPASILSKTALWESMVAYNNKAFVPYPPCLHGLNTKVKGMRTGEIALFVSGTGVGKSTLIREIVLHLVETTDSKIGVLALEEAPGETARKLSAAKLNQNPADCPMSLDELKPGFDAVFDDDRVLVLDHQGSINDESIVDLLDFMALAGCKYIFIDHLTILISEGVEKLTGNEAQDRMMNDLLRLVKRNDVYVGLVSHLRKTGTSSKAFEEGQLPNLDDIKGSGSTKQISMDILAFARDMTSEKEGDRNRILMSVLKCRHTGLTGPVEGMIYNYKTGRLTRESEYVPDSFKALDTNTIVVSNEKVVDSNFVAEF